MKRLDLGATDGADPRGETVGQVVLIVDDDENTRSMLASLVSEFGLTAVEAENGVSAMAHARQAPPDLILVDIDMPVMDGREVLALLKADPALRSIPVIVISGVDETAVAVKCIEGGAEDYLSKPFNPVLLQARIRSSLERAALHAREIAYQQRVEQYGLLLEERVRQKTRALADAHARLSILDRAKDDFLRLISHELRTPMTGMVATSEMLNDESLDAPGRREALQVLRMSVGRLRRIIEDALLLTEIQVSSESFRRLPCALGAITRTAVARAEGLGTVEGVRLEPVIDDAVQVLGDEGLLGQALASLFECAMKFSAPDQVVRIECAPAGESLSLRIRARGHPIPSAAIPRFFEVLSLGEPITAGDDLGLAPPVAAQILRILGASVTVEALPDGTCFIVSLQPAGPPPTVV